MNIDWKLLFELFLKTFVSFNGNDLRHIVDNVESTIESYLYQRNFSGIVVEDAEVEEIRKTAKDIIYSIYERNLSGSGG